MPRMDALGVLETPRLDATVVRCDGVDGPRRDEAVSADRVWFVLRGRFALTGPRLSRAGDPMTALLLRRGEPFCIRHPEGCGDLCLAVGGSAAADAVDRGCALAPLSAGDFVRLRALAGALARGRAVEPLAIEEALCAALEPDPHPSSASPRERRLAEAVWHAIALRFDERISLAELAAPHGVSVFTLCRAFRRARGASVHRSRQRLRLRHALALMLDTDWPLARVAAECGFASHAHLTDRFRRELGITPARARRSGGRARVERAR